jgi:hypothetical protein
MAMYYIKHFSKIKINFVELSIELFLTFIYNKRNMHTKEVLYGIRNDKFGDSG